MDVELSFTPTELSYADWKSKYNMEFSAIKTNLPPNVHLLTLEQLDESDSVLIRLEHFFEAKEHKELSKPVQVNLEDILTQFQILEMEEVSLGANMALNEMNRLKWKVQRQNDIPSVVDDIGLRDSGTTIVLKPMEIRSFILKVKEM